MARIRSVKVEMRTSKLVASWPFEVRYFFVLLWGYLDDKGRGLDIPKMIAADCFPRDEKVTAAKVDSWLDLMTRNLQGGQGPICRYEVDGVHYLHSVNWSEHQKPNRPTPSKLPACELHEDSSDVPHGNSVPGEGEVGEGVGEGEGPPPRTCTEHAKHSDPPPCVPCKNARLARESWEQQNKTRTSANRLSTSRCRLCDGDGWRYEPGRRIVATPYERCDHREQQEHA